MSARRLIRAAVKQIFDNLVNWRYIMKLFEESRYIAGLPDYRVVCLFFTAAFINRLADQCHILY